MPLNFMCPFLRSRPALALLHFMNGMPYGAAPGRNRVYLRVPARFRLLLVNPALRARPLALA